MAWKRPDSEHAQAATYALSAEELYALHGEVERLRAALALTPPALLGYDGHTEVWCNVCDRKLPDRGVGQCPNGDTCPVLLSGALPPD